MKRSGVRIGKKTLKPKRQQQAARRIQSLRGKYKHLDLMKSLVEAREEERQFASKTPYAISTRSLKVLDKSVANLKKGRTSAPIAPPNWKIQ